MYINIILGRSSNIAVITYNIIIIILLAIHEFMLAMLPGLPNPTAIY